MTPQMSEKQSRAFLDAAKWFNVYILVRRTNVRSLAYVGDPGCVPKRLDCKAKTAGEDYTHPRHGYQKVAGLVVDPTVTGPGAYANPRKYQSAMKEWEGFSKTMLDPAVATEEGQSRLTYIPGGKFYFVDLDPRGGRYGCVKFSSNSLMSAGKYIHGDFDLYGIVRADDPGRNVAVREVRLANTHVRSPEFFDVQHYVNRKIGVPMVLHGGQESYSAEHSDEGLDVFTPDGRFFGVENAAEIARLYETAFKGRRLFTKSFQKEMTPNLFHAAG
ncbi:MAG TPA: hypothetical protein VMP03_08325 [Methylomirabilota bacterium]|nr:hypothetical protein [Methylomirabilota bacterium]